MYSEDHASAIPTQITFHYINGHSESFTIHELADPDALRQDIRHEIRRFLSENWWVVKLEEETIFINASNVLKVELKPPVISIAGEGVLTEATRVTALTQGKRSF